MGFTEGFMFIGRTAEIEQLKQLKKKNSASLVCVLGRRRIGKSALIEQFGKSFDSYLVFQGLGPDEHAGLQLQLDHFSKQLSEQTNTREQKFTNWSDAFDVLAKATNKDEVLVLFDEISWMAKGDIHYASKLKDSWDLKFKKNPKMILVLCGSVSSWIQDNILENSNFEGRISLRINLLELQLNEINLFLNKKGGHFSNLEKILITSVTGGVPKYLEEILPSETAEANIMRMCFNPSGILFNDYQYIFTSVLGRRSKTLDTIIRQCLVKRYTPANLAAKLGMPLNGDFTKSLQILELSGFLSRDYCFLPNGASTNLSMLRVKDNYLRFYLKVISPYEKLIQKGGVRLTSLKDIKNFEAMLGLQLENLVLQNRQLIHQYLGLLNNQIVSSAPYLQRKTVENKGGCQIDLLIQGNLDVFFACEIKCKKIIGKSIAMEVKNKLKVLSLPKRSALKPILIYVGEIEDSARDYLEDYFFKLIDFSDFFQ
jgi:hypothetical protein